MALNVWMKVLLIISALSFVSPSLEGERSALLGVSKIVPRGLNKQLVGEDVIGFEEQSDAHDLKERGLDERGDDWFALRAYSSGSKYQKSKGSWMAFSEGGDAYVTHNWDEGAKFRHVGDNLMVGRKWVTFHFSNGYTVWKLGRHQPRKGGWRFWRDSWGWLHIGGYHGHHGWGVGWGEGVTCVSDDGPFFVEGDKHTPFRCRPVDLCHGHGPHEHPPPNHPHRPHPPHHPPHHPPRPTTTKKPHPPHHPTRPPHHPTHSPHPTTTSKPTRTTTKPNPTKTTKSTRTTTTSKMTTTSSPSPTTTSTYSSTTTAYPSGDPDPDMDPHWKRNDITYYDDEEEEN